MLLSCRDRHIISSLLLSCCTSTLVSPCLHDDARTCFCFAHAHAQHDRRAAVRRSSASGAQRSDHNLLSPRADPLIWCRRAPSHYTLLTHH
ncbi:hypothetical protein C8R45DRAFT_464984 [Mycena sanguinolenta]|nr:hypothetical protein C8R45DRAFT_464984 [Mycena sanguinolenta]